MLRFHLSELDLAAIRFGISPLCEMGLSLRALKQPARYPLQLPWARRTEAARTDLDLDVLLALTDNRLWTPDFLNPRPDSPLTKLDEELSRLAAISSEQFTRQLVQVHGRLPDVFSGSPVAARDRTVRALTEYWEACFQPYWPRMRAVLEADIVYRGRQLAHGGLATVFGGLSSTISLDGTVVSVRLRDPNHRTELVGGGGLTLVPTLFTQRSSVPTAEGQPAMILYPARGQGALWETETVANPAALSNLLGATRASLLTALGEPASSTELGVRFGISTSAVNQQLRALKNAGLLTTTRYGHSVLYLRSELGSALLGRGAPTT